MHGPFVDNIVETNPLRAVLFVLQNKDAVLKYDEAVGHHLSFSQDDSRAADPRTLVTIMANVAFPLFRIGKSFWPRIFCVRKPSAPTCRLHNRTVGILRVGTA